MVRRRIVTESVLCDVCGKESTKATTHTISFGTERWELDVCPADLKALTAQFAAWASIARPVPFSKRRPRRQAQDEWDYLESKGFTRHRGRKSAAEAEALARRR